tara:strand:+ start:206 stop:466 length:261 start_codon:yes stop_codon:yes gene_type:complete
MIKAKIANSLFILKLLESGRTLDFKYVKDKARRKDLRGHWALMLIPEGGHLWPDGEYALTNNIKFPKMNALSLLNRNVLYLNYYVY